MLNRSADQGGPRAAARTRPVFYVSAHPGDAVLSCGGGLAADGMGREGPTLLTVFTPVRSADLRRAEDRAAAALLGCRLLTLDLPEAAGRLEGRGLWGVPSPFEPLGQRHLGLAREIVSGLRRHVPDGAEVHAPLGVGGHIDRRVTQVAAAALAEERGLYLWLYEDLPYSLARHALGRRLAAMGAVIAPGAAGAGASASDPTLTRGTRSEEVGAYLSYLLERPGANGGLPWPLRRLLLRFAAAAAVTADRQGHQPGPRPHLRPVLRDVTAQRAARLAAAAAYATEWPRWFGSLGQMDELLCAYGRELGGGHGGVVYERRWLHDATAGEW